ncbi:hypothetical protein CD351_08930 [Erythrobacter sp. KY5]|nr:hypothetical protein CD351_08930 [Erythrobacter sp. KY5]
MDANEQMHYVGRRMMARHLIALFALFTGIAALSAPAHAGEVQSNVQNARSVANASESQTSENCSCASEAENREAARPKRERKRTWTWFPSWLRPSIFLGGDRALE